MGKVKEMKEEGKSKIKQTKRIQREDVRCASDAVIRKLDTTALFGFHDMAGSVLEDLKRSGNHVFTAQSLGAITAEESNDALTRVQNMMTEYGIVKERLAKALSSRMKKEMRISKSPLEIHVALNQLATDYPGLKEDLEKLQQEKQEKEQERLLAEQEKNKKLEKLVPAGKKPKKKK
jgi:hypothetical protein